MYFAHGWPKVFAAKPGPDDVVFQLQIDHQYILAVSRTSIQVWASGQHRLRLGICVRGDEEIAEEGFNVQAFWSTSRNALAVVTSANYLHFYAVVARKDPVIPLARVPAHDLRKVDVYLRNSVSIDSRSRALCISGDGKILVLGLEDGSLVSYSWLGKMRGQCDLQQVLSQTLELDDENGVGPSDNYPVHPMGSPTSSDSFGETKAVMQLHYSEVLSLMVLVFRDGSCALVQVPESGLSQLQLELSAWLCPPSRQAVYAQIGPSAQMVAVGCASGEVGLYRLNPSSLSHFQASAESTTADPYGMLVRMLSLHDWGHRTSETGAVSQVQWTPDCRAVAVGYFQQGLAVWSPSGCRLACSLRQTPSLNSSVHRTQSLAPTPSLQDVLDSGDSLLDNHEGGVTALCWGQAGYQLLVAENGPLSALVELQFAKTLPNNHRVACGRGQLVRRAMGPNTEVHILQAHDRILMIMENGDSREPLSAFREESAEAEGSATDLAVHHVQVPSNYVSANWPIVHTAVSANGVNIAVAGRRGFAVYSRQSERWRLFGDVSQERNINCLALCWLENIVVVVSSLSTELGKVPAGGTGPCELLLFPRYHLDFGSLLGRYALKARPVAIDSIANFILVASEPLELAVLQVELQGMLSPASPTQPVAHIRLVRELSMMNAGLPLLDIALVPPPHAARETENGNGHHASLPKHCVLLRWGGLMSVLDMERGSELPLSSDVESFWLSDSHPHHLSLAPQYSSARTSVDGFRFVDMLGSGDVGRVGVTDNSMETSTSTDGEVEMPWWAYGAKGMQLWFPSSLSQPLSPLKSPSSTAPMDIELEFDREVYPVGISWSDAAIVGLTQRLVGGMTTAGAPSSTAGAMSFPCFHLLPESQPVLPCLLRRLLQKGASGEALLLARRHQHGHHFGRSLEWLLFTALELDVSKKPSAKRQALTTMRRSLGENFPSGRSPTVDRRLSPMYVSPLLHAAADLIRHFPQFADIVVSVARKTDASLWPTLFAAVGSPSVLLEGLLEGGALRSAACFLLVIDRLEGAALAHALALRLLRAGLKRSQYQLCAELLRFLIPPGEMDTLFGATDNRRTSNSSNFGPSTPSPELPPAPSVQPPPPAEQSYTSWLFSLFQSAPEPPPTVLPSSSSQDVSKRGDSLTGSIRGDRQRSNSLGSRPSLSRNSSGRKSVLEDLGDSSLMVPGIDACKLVADHGWSALEGGRLAAVAQLSAAMTFLPGGLAALLNCSWDPVQLLPPVPQPPSCAADLLSAVGVAVQELPVWDSDRVLKDAEMVVELAQQVGAVMWAVAVAVVMVDVKTVTSFRASYASTWDEFCRLLKADASFEFLHDVVDMLSASGPAENLDDDSLWLREEPEGGGNGWGPGGPDAGGLHVGNGVGTVILKPGMIGSHGSGKLITEIEPLDD